MQCGCKASTEAQRTLNVREHRSTALQPQCAVLCDSALNNLPSGVSRCFIDYAAVIFPQHLWNHEDA